MDWNRNDTPTTLAETLLSVLLNANTELAYCYFHLFSIFSHDSLNSTLTWVYDEYMEEKDKPADEQWWFTSFHKSMRQTDFFEDTYTTYFTPLPDKELEEFDSLMKEYKAVSMEEFEQWKKDNPEKMKRLRELKGKQTHKERISGHLDMILWNLIYVDADNYIYKTLINVFNEYNAAREPEPAPPKLDEKNEVDQSK